jgi:predicted O-methyltransferase YrrM
LLLLIQAKHVETARWGLLAGWRAPLPGRTLTTIEEDPRASIARQAFAATSLQDRIRLIEELH